MAEGGIVLPGQAMRGRVDVMGGDVFRGPMLSSSDVNQIVVREAEGSPIMFLQRLADDTWAFCTRGDADWEDAKARFGVR